MCGIAGVVRADEARARQEALLAEDVQKHRGPDGAGIHVDRVARWTIGLSHRRLSIIDLTETGSQPMISHDGRHWLSYNGELYNYREIRPELEALGHRFSGSSDSEVLLAALEQWGEQALPKFNGMWAFAWLDRARGRLVLCRDRMGVKPLYVCIRSDAVYFASEIKAILAMSGERFTLNSQVVGEYVFQSLLETGQETFFRGIVKIPPGTSAVVDLNAPSLDLRVSPFWSIEPVEQRVSLEEGAARVRELLTDAVRLRLRSDVPVGVLLSGGLDSSSIAACMHSLLGPDANLNLLSAVSDGSRFDEAPFIDTMARHLGRPVSKVSLEIDAKNALELLSQVCWYNDEPVGGFANVAHYLLMKRAKDLGITVILSGQGADEIFCGYRKFLGFYLQQQLREGRAIAAGRTLFNFWSRGTVVNQFSWNEAKRYLPRWLSTPLTAAGGPALAEYQPVAAGLARDAQVRDRQIADLRRFSVPILTHYEDRMSMAWSREVRTPFLDYRLVETAIALPTELKLAFGWTKFVLRKAMEPLLPASIAWRKDKQNFVNPQSEWLKRDLKPAVLEVLNGDSLIFRLGLLSRASVLALYERYCRQPVDAGAVSFKEVFQPLALEMWLRNYEKWIAA